MKNSDFEQQEWDFAIVGAGPIGAATAYALSRQAPGARILALTREPMDDVGHAATYRYAGGSVRWYWTLEDPQERARMTGMTRATADLALALHKQGVDLSLIEDSYVFLTTGKAAPSINLSGQKLVEYLLADAGARGVAIQKDTELSAVSRAGSAYELYTSRGTFRARRVLLALGAATPDYVPQANIKWEKRELCVLDLPMDEHRAHFPHLIAPLAGGVAYLFAKQTAAGMKLVLGEEDIIAHSERRAGEDFLPELQRRGLEALFPFLKGAKTEQVLWGFDAAHKFPRFDTDGAGLLAVTCGSAVRSCIGIGQEAAKRLRTP